MISTPQNQKIWEPKFKKEMICTNSFDVEVSCVHVHQSRDTEMKMKNGEQIIFSMEQESK